LSLLDDSGIMAVKLHIDYSHLSAYEIPTNKIGSGRYGTVYKGEYNYASVAIKVLNTQDLSDDAYAEFKREVSLMAPLRSPYIVTLYGACLTKLHYAIVMEYLPKGSLYKVLRTEELSWIVKYQIGLDVALGLAYLHTFNMIHGDLKSLNVLIESHFGAKIADFGFAKLKIS